MNIKQFDLSYLEDGTLYLHKLSVCGTTGFIITIQYGSTGLYSTKGYGMPKLEKEWFFYNVEEAYDIGMSFT